MEGNPPALGTIIALSILLPVALIFHVVLIVGFAGPAWVAWLFGVVFTVQVSGFISDVKAFKEGRMK